MKIVLIQQGCAEVMKGKVNILCLKMRRLT